MPYLTMEKRIEGCLKDYELARPLFKEGEIEESEGLSGRILITLTHVIKNRHSLVDGVEERAIVVKTALENFMQHGSDLEEYRKRTIATMDRYLAEIEIILGGLR